MHLILFANEALQTLKSICCHTIQAPLNVAAVAAAAAPLLLPPLLQTVQLVIRPRPWQHLSMHEKLASSSWAEGGVVAARAHAFGAAVAALGCIVAAVEPGSVAAQTTGATVAEKLGIPHLLVGALKQILWSPGTAASGDGIGDIGLSICRVPRFWLSATIRGMYALAAIGASSDIQVDGFTDSPLFSDSWIDFMFILCGALLTFQNVCLLSCMPSLWWMY